MQRAVCVGLLTLRLPEVADQPVLATGEALLGDPLGFSRTARPLDQELCDESVDSFVEHTLDHRCRGGLPLTGRLAFGLVHLQTALRAKAPGAFSTAELAFGLVYVQATLRVKAPGTRVTAVCGRYFIVGGDLGIVVGVVGVVGVVVVIVLVLPKAGFIIISGT